MGHATASGVFFATPPGALGRGKKFKYHLISITKSISKILYQTLCFFLQMKDTKHIRRNFNSAAWVMPQGSDFGALGVPRGSKKFFSNIVMWHIKSSGMTSRTECKLNFHPRVKLVTPGVGLWGAGGAQGV